MLVVGRRSSLLGDPHQAGGRSALGDEESVGGPSHSDRQRSASCSTTSFEPMSGNDTPASRPPLLVFQQLRAPGEHANTASPAASLRPESPGDDGESRPVTWRGNQLPPAPKLPEGASTRRIRIRRKDLKREIQRAVERELVCLQEQLAKQARLTAIHKRLNEDRQRHLRAPRDAEQKQRQSCVSVRARSGSTTGVQRPRARQRACSSRRRVAGSRAASRGDPGGSGESDPDGDHNPLTVRARSGRRR